MKHQKRILVLFTRIYGKRGHPQSDEFVSIWGQETQRGFAILKNQQQYLILIDGSQKEYAFDAPEKIVAALVLQLRMALETLPPIPGGETVILFHPLLSDKIFIEQFTQCLYQDFARYSISRVAAYNSGNAQYAALEELAAQIRLGMDFSETFKVVWKTYVHTDLALETELSRLHHTLSQYSANSAAAETVFPAAAPFSSQPIYLLWNEDATAALLQNASDKNIVFTSKNALKQHLKKIKYLIVLAELTWEHHKFTHFYGYDLIKSLIEEGYTFNIAFASFLTRCQLREKTAAAALLARCFPHFLLQTDRLHFPASELPTLNAVDWAVIRQCYVSPTGFCDRILHELKHLNIAATPRQISQTLREIQLNSQLFSNEIVSCSQKLLDILNNAPESHIQYSLRDLQHQMENFVRRLTITEPPRVSRSPFRVMLVEDDPITLNILQKGFEAYFQVEGFTCGQTALAELRKNHDAYDVLLVDLELLDPEGSRQEVQGHHIIQSAQQIPHLVIYMLTSHSRHFISVVQQELQRSQDIQALPGYIPKHAHLGLRTDYSYATLAHSLIKEIKQKSHRQQGPQIGLWGKGMLQAYYRILATEQGENLWNEVIECVESCIAAGHNNDEKVPQTLFSINTRQFTYDKIKTILIHRLLCLYLQYADHKVIFETGIKQLLQLNQNSPQKYFGTLLGFSVHSERHTLPEDSVYHVCYLQKYNLFPQEVHWLQRVFPEDPTLRYPVFVALLSKILSNPILAALGIWEIVKSLDSLGDCELFLKHIVHFPKSRQELAAHFDWYCHFFSREFKTLQQDPNCQKLVADIQELLPNPDESGNA